jgi:hypothetical protein
MRKKQIWIAMSQDLHQQCERNSRQLSYVKPQRVHVFQIEVHLLARLVFPNTL